MKKSLYMTTALVAAGVMAFGVSGAMAAEKEKKITLQLSGFMKALVGYADQKGSFENSGSSTTQTSYDGFNTVNDSEIYFKGSTKLDNGITVGVHVEMETDQAGAGIIDGSFMQLSAANFGTLRLGSTIPVTAAMAQSAGNVGAINLVNGDTNNWIINPGTMTGTSVSTTNAANDRMKVVYMTPSIALGSNTGLVLGANYTPSETTVDTMPAVGGNSGTDLQTFAADIQVKTKIGSASIGADLGYWASSGPEATQNKNVRFGVKVGFGPWTVGTSRKETKDSASSDLLANDTYDAGLSWKGGDWTIGVQMVNSASPQTAAVSGDDEITKYSIGAVYNMGPGVDLVGTIAHVDWSEEGTTTSTDDNSGVAAVGGISVSF